MILTESDIRRFHAKYTRGAPDDCWPWTAGKSTDGYGRLRVQGKSLNAPRIAFYLEHGRWPVTARHTCDNPPCTNPAHIIDGTQADNVADMLSRDRSPVIGMTGERNPYARLSRAQVDDLRRRHAEGTTVRQLARELDYDESSMSKLLRGVLWR